jgi:hypothetical protein
MRDGKALSFTKFRTQQVLCALGQTVAPSD